MKSCLYNLAWYSHPCDVVELASIALAFAMCHSVAACAWGGIHLLPRLCVALCHHSFCLQRCQPAAAAAAAVYPLTVAVFTAYLSLSQQWYVKLALKLLWERQLGSASAVEGYVNVLPAQGSFETLVHWTDQVGQPVGWRASACLIIRGMLYSRRIEATSDASTSCTLF